MNIYIHCCFTTFTDFVALGTKLAPTRKAAGARPFRRIDPRRVKPSSARKAGAHLYFEVQGELPLDVLGVKATSCTFSKSTHPPLLHKTPEEAASRHQLTPG